MGIQPRFNEPIGINPPVLGGGMRRGSIVEFQGKRRNVLEILTKPVDVPGFPIEAKILPSSAGPVISEGANLPVKMVVTYIKIADGTVPISAVKLIRI